MVSNIVELSSSTKFNWRIQNFSKLAAAQKEICSDVFSVGCFKWKALIYPKGWGEPHEHISMYLMPIYPDGLTKLVDTEYWFAVSSQTDLNNTVKREITRTFPDNGFSSWGWPKFMRISELHDPSKGYIVNDTCTISVEVTCTIHKNDQRYQYRVRKTEENEKQTNQGYNDMKLLDFSSSSKFDWRVENFSKLNDQPGTFSDVFSVGNFKWKARIYPKGDNTICGCGHLSLFLRPVDLTKSVDTVFSLAVTNQTDPRMKVNREVQYNFPETSLGRGWSKFMSLSELHDPAKGYIVNDTCVITVEVTCTTNKETKDDNDVNEGRPDKLGKTENEKQTKEKTDKRSTDPAAYPGAGQLFGEGRHNNKVGFGEDKEEFADVGGFSVLKTQAPLYKKIWLKYGHIPSTKVMPMSLYPILVMLVKDLMNCISDMSQCRYLELSSKMIEHWEEMIVMAEKNEFNIGWLRERLETVKKGMGGMQDVKTELLEHGQPLRASKDKMKILTGVMKKVEVQLIEAKANVREKTCGLLSESDMEMYLEIGENFLLDGLF